MGALLLLLAVTNLLALGVLAWVLVRPTPDADRLVADAIAARAPAQFPSDALPPVRHVITLELLNAGELLAARGRLLGLAGTTMPTLAQRLIAEGAVRQIRTKLRRNNVLADVRLHTIRTPAPHAVLVDEVSRLDWTEQGAGY